MLLSCSLGQILRLRTAHTTTESCLVQCWPCRGSRFRRSTAACQITAQHVYRPCVFLNIRSAECYTQYVLEQRKALLESAALICQV